MPLHEVPESAITGTEGVTAIPIRVLDDDGTTARVIAEGPGIHVRQGHVHTVPSDAIQRAH